MTKAVKLERRSYPEVHPATGEKIEVTEYRRGLLATQTKTFQNPVTFFNELSSESPRKHFEGRCDFLRDFLESRCLPSDRQPFWVRFNDEDWKQNYSRKTELPEPGQRISHALWISRLKDLTEPLSQERCAGDLLWMLTNLLKRPAIDEHLWHIGRLLDEHFKFRLSGRLNELAQLGVKGRKARESGPKAKQLKSKKTLEIIAACTDACWAVRPELRGVAIRTAEAIEPEVNAKLKSDCLLSRGQHGLRPKTIGDYIRKNIRA